MSEQNKELVSNMAAQIQALNKQMEGLACAVQQKNNAPPPGYPQPAPPVYHQQVPYHPPAPAPVYTAPPQYNQQPAYQPQAPQGYQQQGYQGRGRDRGRGGGRGGGGRGRGRGYYQGGQQNYQGQGGQQMYQGVDSNKDKVINNNKTHKVFMGTKKSMLPIPIQPSTSTTGTIAGHMAMMCPMDTPAQPAPIQHLDTCGMPLVRIHAMAAGRDSTKQPGLDGEGRMRVH